MKTLKTTAAALIALTAGQQAAEAQYYQPLPQHHIYRPVPNLPGTIYGGVKGWHRFGWEAGRIMSQRQYGVDPGNYPGFYSRRAWSRPW